MSYILLQWNLKFPISLSKIATENRFKITQIFYSYTVSFSLEKYTNTVIYLKFTMHYVEIKARGRMDGFHVTMYGQLPYNSHQIGCNSGWSRQLRTGETSTGKESDFGC